MAQDLPDETKLTEADRANETAFSNAIDATEWLIDTKHTLKGMPIDRTSALLNILLQEGATELRVDQIFPDSKDPAFQSAGQLLIKLPRTGKGRKDVLQFVSNMTGLERLDRGQSVVEISFQGELKQ
jgi:hypothetical protein